MKNGSLKCLILKCVEMSIIRFLSLIFLKLDLIARYGQSNRSLKNQRARSDIFRKNKKIMTIKAAKKMIEYCRRDTEITGRFVETMREKYESVGAELKTTVASSTLSFFESQFFKRVSNPFTEEQLDWFHTGYYGGRTEVFFNKPVAGKIFYHDVNGLYAFCLKTGVFPVLEHFYETKKPNLEFEGLAECEVTAPGTLSIPYLPVRHEGKLVFPTGNFRGVYTYFEIREAKKLGYEMGKVYRSIEFPERFNPFERFIESVNAQRLLAKEKGDLLLDHMWKDFGNHSYGKWAQNNDSTKMFPTRLLSKCDCQLKENERCKIDRHLKGGDEFFGERSELVFRNAKTDYARYANCIWSMYTTAQARHVLYPYLTEVEKAGGLLLYCDTDSVIYEHRHPLFPDSKDLGGMKLERPKSVTGKDLGDFYVYAHFKLPKLYCLKEPSGTSLYRSKGVPTCSNKSEHGANCQCLAKEFFENGKVQFKKPNKMRESFRRNISPNRKYKVIPNYWEFRQKEIKGRYTKRIVLKDGSTRPLVLNRTDQ